MTPLLLTLPGVPQIEIHVQHDGPADEQQRVDDREDEIELINKPGGKLRVRREEHENEQATSDGGHTEKDNRHLCDFFGQAIVPKILLPIPQPFCDHDKDRGTENECPEQRMK